MFSLSGFQNYYVLQVPGLICSLLMLFVTPMIPESPAYSIEIGDKDAAEQSLKILRGPNYDASEEIKQLEKDSEIQRSRPSLRRIFAVRANRISLFLGLTTMVFRQFSGINVILHFAEYIFAEIAPDFSPIASSVGVGVITIAASIVSVFLFDVVGRKTLMIVSGIGMTGSFWILSTDFALLEKDATPLACIAIFSIFAYLISYGIGCGSGSWILLSELFSLELKYAANSAAIVLNFICAFVITGLFRLSITVVGNSFTFYVLAVVCILDVLFILVAIPETKKKHLRQIQQDLETDRSFAAAVSSFS